MYWKTSAARGAAVSPDPNGRRREHAASFRFRNRRKVVTRPPGNCGKLRIRIRSHAIGFKDSPEDVLSPETEQTDTRAGQTPLDRSRDRRGRRSERPVGRALPRTPARKSPSNRTAVVFAVSSDTAYRQQALAQGANFVFERPFILAEIRNVLRAAYDLMIRERRRYFRCAAELPILLVKKTSGTDIRCTTINVSSSGMALATPSSLTLGEEVEIVLLLQGGLTIRASGTVVWDDKHGKSGISFRCRTPQMQAALDSWLGAHFFELLSSRGDHAQWLSP